jgi:hypothetical protein
LGKVPLQGQTEVARQSLVDRISKFLSKQHDSAHVGELAEIARELKSKDLKKSLNTTVNPTFICKLLRIGIAIECWSAVNDIITHEHPSSCQIPDLFTQLIHANQLTSVMLSVIHLPSIADEDLVAAVRMVLDAPANQCIECLTTIGGHEAPTGDPVIAKHKLLELVLSVKPENIFTSSFLRLISITHVIALLQFLLHKIESFSQYGIDTTNKLQFPVVLSWLTMILDTHFTQLILTPECHTLMRSLGQLVNAEAQYCHDACKLSGELQHFHDMSINPLSGPSSGIPDASSARRRSVPHINSTENIGQYKLETVSLWV